MMTTLDNLTTIRAKVNTWAGSRGGLGGLIGYWYFYADQVIDWQVFQLLQPGNLEAFVTGSVAAFTGVGAIAGWNRDQISPRQAPVSPSEASKPVVVSTPAPTVPVPVELDAPLYNDDWSQPTSYFSDAELECKGIDCPSDCVYTGMSAVTLGIANDLREHFGLPVIVNSGYRCATHNRNVGGEDGSYHVKSRAMDIRIPGVTPAQIYEYLTAKYRNRYGFGQYKNFVHIDDRIGVFGRKDSPGANWINYPVQPDIKLA